MTRLCGISFVLLGAVVSTGQAHAQPAARRVVLVEPGPTLERAVTLSLAPWSLEVRAIGEPSPGSSMPGSADRGRAVARAHDALAVVWISTSDDGFALWVYDRRADRVVARALPSAPPFDEPTAAQVALVIKTLLRAEPPLEALEEQPGSSEVERPEATVSDRWGAMLGAGVRGFATAPATADVRVVLGVTYWPAALDRSLGVALFVSSGPGVEHLSDSLSARWTDSSFMLALRGRLPLGEVVDLGLTVGVGARLTTLEGAAADGRVPVSQLRLDPAGRAELELGARATPWLRFELRVGTEVGFRQQRYFVNERVELEVMPAGLHGTLGVELSP